MRGYHHYLEPIDLQELRRLGIGRPGHPGELLVQAEVILERDRGNRLVLLANGHAFLRLYGLMQSVRPAPAGHRAAGELIDDDDFAVANDVLDIAFVERLRAQRRIQVMHQADVGGVVQALAFTQQSGFEHQLLHPLVAFFGQVHLLALLVDREVAGRVLLLLPCELRHQLIDADVDLGALFRRPRDDQWGASLIDQDRIDLIDYRVGQ